MSIPDRIKSGVNAVLRRTAGVELRRAAVRTSPCASLAWLEKIPVRTFIDVGAHTGEYVDWAAKTWPGAKILAFEPLPQCAAGLRAKRQTIPSLEVFDCALGAADEAAALYRSSYAPASSLLPMTDITKSEFPEAAGMQAENVTVRRLDSVLDAGALAREIFVKIDTQGYEDRVIDGGQAILDAARVVQIEVSFETLYEGQVLFEGIHGRLTARGLVFSGIKNQVCSPADGKILQAHAYYLRPA